ncbi:MAG: YidC/Oxa1 family membrane protein insertase [Chloroflexi bacterium]|nr:MAG: YidC/Oxa1 family membrane protein insertase [Chloroflexota bacterium]
MEAVTDIFWVFWNQGIMRPMVNLLLILYTYLFQNFGLAIIAFTVIVHFLTLPLTLRQIRQTKAMSEIQPRIQDLRKRYGQDRQRMSQETMRLYKEFGVSPVGCLGPLIIQMPILLGMYQALIRVLPTSPERLMELGNMLYPGVNVIHGVVPVNGRFLWMDLSVPDSIGILAILVAGSMWLMQKMSTTPSTDPAQAKQQRMMLWMMPAFFAILAFTLPSGLSFYIFVSNLFRLVTQYFVGGLGSLRASSQPIPAGVASALSTPSAAKEQDSDGDTRQLGSGSEERRGSHRNRPKGTRRRTKRGRG